MTDERGARDVRLREELAVELCGASWNHSGGVGRHNAAKYGPCSQHEADAEHVERIVAARVGEVVERVEAVCAAGLRVSDRRGDESKYAEAAADGVRTTVTAVRDALYAQKDPTP